MSVKIRLARLGKIHAPQYRVVVIDERKKRNGRFIEEVGRYVPTQHPSLIEITSDRVQYWLSVGAQPSDQVRKLLELTGDWGKFVGDAKASKSTVEVAEPKAAFVRNESKKSVVKPNVKKVEAEAPKAEAAAAPAEA